MDAKLASNSYYTFPVSFISNNIFFPQALKLHGSFLVFSLDMFLNCSHYIYTVTPDVCLAPCHASKKIFFAKIPS